MRITVRLLRAFTYVWAALVLGFVAISIAGFMMAAETWWDGIQQVQQTFSPFNLWNTFFMLAISSPAFGAWMLAERLGRD